LGAIKFIEHKHQSYCYNKKLKEHFKFIRMKKNMGSFDKLLRLTAAIVLIVLFYSGVITGTIGIIALVVALIFTVTSLISFCPLYALLGIRTCKKE